MYILLKTNMNKIVEMLNLQRGVLNLLKPTGYVTHQQV